MDLRRLCHRHLRGIQHILNENSVSRGGIIDEDVGNRADELAVPDEGAAAQVCGQERTTIFRILYDIDR